MRWPFIYIKRLCRVLKRRDLVMLVMGGLIVGAVVMVGHIAINLPVPLQYKAQTVGIPWLPQTVKHWSSTIDEMAKKYNVDADLIAVVVTLESGGYSKAHSNADAQGLMQITPPTAQDIAAKFVKKPQKNYNLQDPRTNIEFGAAYLAYLRNEFGMANQGPDWATTVELVAAGYNGGPGAANALGKGLGLHDTQTVSYSRDAYNMWRERHAISSPTFDRWKERGGSSLLDLAASEK